MIRPQPIAATLALRDDGLRPSNPLTRYAGDIFDCASAMRRDVGLVRSYLKRMGLWHRDRLSIVIGNHDIFHTPHHGSLPERARELALVPMADAQASFDAFCEFAGDIVDDEDLLSEDGSLYPFAKKLGHVRLWATDTTASVTKYGGNGFWREEHDELLRESTEETVERRLLAIHHPPFSDRLQKLTGIVKGEFPFGFPRPDFERLRQFLRDAEVDAVACGHVHDMGGDPYRWSVGKTKVYMLGRTGGMHETTPVIGALSVPVKGRTRWTEIPVRG